VRWHKLAGAGLTVAAAAAAGSLMAGGVGSAATSRSAAPQQPPHVAAPQPTKAAVAAVTPTDATISKMYLQVSGITGDVTDTGYKGAIAAFSESWGVSNPAATGTGKADLSDVSIQFNYDKAEPLLEHDAEVGATIPTVTLTEWNSTSGKIRQYVFTNAHIDSVSIGAAGGGNATVSLSLSYQQRQITYYYKDVNNNPRHVTSCWNIVNENACTG
jgi:type VI protein secretion system component Hcp